MQVGSADEDKHQGPGQNGDLQFPSLGANTSSGAVKGQVDRFGAAAALEDLAAQVGQILNPNPEIQGACVKMWLYYNALLHCVGDDPRA